MWKDSLGRADSKRKGSLTWKRTEGQSLWIRISLAFLAFYVGEAVLFWQGLALAKPVFRIPLAFPLLYPLGYWGLFGFVVYRIQIRKLAFQAQSAAERRFLRWQRGLMTLVITIGVVGSAFLVIKGSGSTTLGHVILFFAMFQAAAVIGAMELNIGWLAAAGLWLLTALAIDSYPVTLRLVPHIKDEDVLIGLATSLGFFLIGVFPQCVDRERLGLTRVGFD
jgi:hypothetical protein